MSLSTPIELKKARKLIDEGKHDEALQLIKNFEKNKEKSNIDVLSFNLLEIDILFQQGLYEKALEETIKVYERSKEIGSNITTIDALLSYINLLFYLENLDKSADLIEEAENLLKKIKDISNNVYLEKEAHLLLLKARLYGTILELKDNPWLEYAEESSTIFEKIGNNRGYIQSQIFYGQYLAMSKGKLDEGITLVKNALMLAEEIKNKYLKASLFRVLMLLFAYKGQFDQSVIYGNQSLNLFETLKNDPRTVASLVVLANIHRRKGEYNLSLELLKRALALQENCNLPSLKLAVLSSLMEVTIIVGDLESAKNYLNSIEKINRSVKIPICNVIFREKKAQLLATSLRAQNRVEAEKIYKEIIEEMGEDLFTVNIYFELIELLLIELEITNDMDVFGEIEIYIAAGSKLAEKTNSFWLMGEILVLKAKMALFKLDLDKARSLLSQGQKIADKHNLELLALKISNEHDELFKDMNLWDELKNSEVSFKERFKFSRLKEQMNNMLNKSAFKPLKMESEQPILLIIMTKRGDPLLFNHFTADLVVDDTRLGKFLSSCNIYCDDIFSETFDRVKFGQYTVLINNIEGFFLCYLFQGQTYSAQQKLKHFSEALNKDKGFIEQLKEAQNEGSLIKVKNNPNIDELIITCFMSDPDKFRMPFEAYEGDDPYVFVSYAHADKLEVYPIIDYLYKMGIKIWYDEGISISDNWKKSIAINLDRCNVFLVFLTSHIIDSEYVRKEISFALKKKKPFYAVYLKETHLPTELEFEIADIQALMKHLMPENDFYTKLYEELSHSLK